MNKKRVLFVSRAGEERVAHEKAAAAITKVGLYETVLYHDLPAVRTSGCNVNPTTDSLEGALASQVIDLLVIDGKVAYDLELARKGQTESRLSSSAQILLAPMYVPVPQPWGQGSNDYLDSTAADFAVNDTTARLPKKLTQAIDDVLQGKDSTLYMFNRNKYQTKVVERDKQLVP